MASASRSISGAVTATKSRPCPRDFARRRTPRIRPSPRSKIRKRKLYGLQFHPEVAHTPRGKEILQNFVFHICGCAMDWTMGSFIEEACERVRRQVGDQKVVLGLSGGVDSSVTAALLHKAIGDQLTCIFVNNGLLRSHEEEMVQRVFGENFHVRLKYVEAADRFLKLLEGVTDPETKRKIIGNEFVKVFEHATEELARGRQGERHGRTQRLSLSRPGNALSGRDRERRDRRQPGARDQEPSQRRRAAGENALRAGRTGAPIIQGRGAAGRLAARFAEGDRLSPAVPGSGLGRAHSRRSHAGAAAHFARCRHDRA